MTNQRKMRNLEERSAIRDGILESATKHGLRDDMYDAISAILDDFVSGQQPKSGTIVRDGIELEYSLPMRRIQKEYVRVHKIQDAK